ncbi:helix-turn-helix domain-containing protein [Parafilimonas sp.]|uniref:helix-turn-helix domain-containing protein n=1 Tax=Parafilimonas sp. TaxID=1969739 RepID=UPI0039E225FD
MSATSLIPVLDWKECMPDSDFLIKMIDDKNIPLRMRAPHRNSGYKVALLLEGKMGGNVDFKKYEIAAPAVLFSSPEQVDHITSYKGVKMIHIAFSRDYLLNDVRATLSCWECMFSQIVIPVINNKDFNELKTYAGLMQQEFVELRHQKDLVIRNLLNAFLITAARLGTCKTKLAVMNATQNKILQQFRALVDDHFLSKTQVAEYADMIYITPGHLNDTIKIITGKTAKQFIDEKRITEAKRLLFWGELTAKQIAAHLNFEDDAYFNRFFKKHTGQTPLLFQKNIL